MSQTKSTKMSVVTVAMLIMVTTFGLSNVIDNLVEMGLAAIPSWFAVGILYFLPLAKFCLGFIVLVSVAAFVVWAESPIRAMFAEVPRGTFPAALTRRDMAL